MNHTEKLNLIRQLMNEISHIPMTEEGKMDYARKLGQSLALKGISITELGNTDTVVDTILHAERTRLIELVEGDMEVTCENKDCDCFVINQTLLSIIHKLKEQ